MDLILILLSLGLGVADEIKASPGYTSKREREVNAIMADTQKRFKEMERKRKEEMNKRWEEYMKKWNKER